MDCNIWRAHFVIPAAYKLVFYSCCVVSYINLGVAETPIHFGTVEVAAVHGEYNTQHFICPYFMP
ncbi:hypothetical protein H6A30_08985 [Bacteroides caecigallinarum]|uniref:Uncharacterized protein n=1 Tax=Candidatus Phocaeicola faecigallinarum TaxID=2838732 RepID=A0A948TD64_9BACT|nr:hypothetical protein [Bacteroides caecigallinarum]MBM6890396.1 hypothetical protein [Bacteroides caecigallinarum]MBU3839018.1 hypothetical protein [Candidatus Phocaeicola faecigallinarum]